MHCLSLSWTAVKQGMDCFKAPRISVRLFDTSDQTFFNFFVIFFVCEGLVKLFSVNFHFISEVIIKGIAIWESWRSLSVFEFPFNPLSFTKKGLVELFRVTQAKP